MCPPPPKTKATFLRDRRGFELVVGDGMDAILYH
jgi:hypothetical protein